MDERRLPDIPFLLEKVVLTAYTPMGIINTYPHRYTQRCSWEREEK